jgi:hypothetical protein
MDFAIAPTFPIPSIGERGAPRVHVGKTQAFADLGRSIGSPSVQSNPVADRLKNRHSKRMLKVSDCGRVPINENLVT